MVTGIEQESIERVAGILRYEMDRLDDPFLPSVEAQLVNYLHLVDAGEMYGLSFGAYLGGIGLGPKAARQYYALVETLTARRAQEAEAEEAFYRVAWPDAFSDTTEIGED